MKAFVVLAALASLVFPAVAAGQVSPRRFDSYRRLLEEEAPD